MGLARVFAGLLWLCATTSAVAALVGSPTPANPCPIAQRYCRARGPESGERSLMATTLTQPLPRPDAHPWQL